MTESLALRNGRIVVDGEVITGGVAIAGGRITAVGLDQSLPDAVQNIDVDGAWILPGVIDPHVHLREPGLTDREDFLSGTSAAAIGGVTACLEMPNTQPPTSSRERLLAKADLVRERAMIDYGLFGLIGSQNLAEIQPMADAGAVAFKMFMHQTVGDIDPCDDGELLEAFERVAETGLRVAIHAENPAIINRRAAQLKAQGRTDTAANLEARPSVSEAEMVDRCIAFAATTGTKIHICHLSAADSVNSVASAKSRGLSVTAETGPQWLWFTGDDAAEKGNILMFSPPFRTTGDREALWEGLRSGTIDMLATDHAPRHAAEKCCDSVWDAKSGFIGVETAVPLLITAVEDGKLSIHDYVRATSTAATHAYGLSSRGGLREGSEANVTVVATGVPGVIRSGELHSKVSATPFDGVPVSARVTHTILRGDLVVDDGRLVGMTRGRNLRAHAHG